MVIDIARIIAAIRAEEYFAIGNDQRFRALERRQLRSSARMGMLIVILVAVFGGVMLSLINRSAGALVIGLHGSLALVAVIGYWGLGGLFRRHPDLIVFVVAGWAVFACVLLAVGAGELVVVASGYLLLIPPVLSLVVPWPTWVHAWWLLLYTVAVMSLLAIVPRGELSPVEKLDVAVLVVVSIGASFVAHVLGFRARVRSYGQLRTIQTLHRSLELEHRDLEAALADLERTSRVDPLTRVANRLRLDEDFEEVRARINRSGATYGLLEADLDRFKAINDELGHLAGDAVLHDVAQALQAVLRAGDHVYRYGGEEFVAIITEADATTTQATAERLRVAIEALAIAHPRNPPGTVVTVSIGATVIGPEDIDETDEALFDRADRAMYAAKTSGRNRVAMDLLPRRSIQSGVVPVAPAETV